MSINTIKNYLTNIINERIKNYSSIIIDSFVEFYGEDNRQIITDRFNHISFLYYITDFDIFYIAKELPTKPIEEFQNIVFSIPYILYLIQNKFYNQKVTEYNFSELGLNKIIGSSSNDLFSESLIQYSIAAALREDNMNPLEVNIPINHDIKRIIALPIFECSDESLFHELNHAICSQIVFRNKKPIIKCGLEYENEEKLYIYEIINDIISQEIYRIFKSKCNGKILDFNILKGVSINNYESYHCLVKPFYESYKEELKLSSIDDVPFSTVRKNTEHEFKELNNLIENEKRSKK